MTEEPSVLQSVGHRVRRDFVTEQLKGLGIKRHFNSEDHVFAADTAALRFLVASFPGAALGSTWFFFLKALAFASTHNSLGRKDGRGCW